MNEKLQVHSSKALSLLGGHVHEENGTAASSTTTQDSGPSAADKYESPLTTTRDRIVRPAIKRLSVAHLWQTFLHILQVFISYLLMLAAQELAIFWSDHKNPTHIQPLKITVTE
ncbi:unnamed protein product [Oppiella nova]|uniref:Copper transport protein n=1 Tax=Oppiella nova TaxID=334625 RepID=A0A7R9MC96_9ACAR|nr:unnamed protein product [Oppiella nova]CAD7657554.1 unnamed protein product [Oppiella nova]CAG2174739.1 unnamed protein product [Oppiella nova]CAG2174740.1 unnamed protein product [Oppiella nova]